MSMTAGELIEEGLCSARCMLAFGNGRCDCPCDGRWHGVLTDTEAGDGIDPVERARAQDAKPRGRVPLPRDPWEGDYPGAPVTDRRWFQVHRHAGSPHLVPIGKYLRERADALVAEALATVPEGSPASVVCRHANRIKTMRPELDDCRYLSLPACRAIIRRLVPEGVGCAT